MKKKQQLESSSNRLINRLYRSRPKVIRQEGETSQQALVLPSLHTEQRQLVPRVNIKQKLPALQPLDLTFRRSKLASFIEKKNTEARGTLNRSDIKAKSRMYSSVDNTFEIEKTLPAAVTVELTKPSEKPQANYLTPEDFMQIIKLDKEMSEEFCYLRKKNSPYDWEIVDFESRDPDEYMVISKRGLTKYVGGVAEFLSMEAFNLEGKTYQRLMEIDYFKTYKKWKNFSIWKRLTKMNRLRECIRAIDNCILLSDEVIKEGINTVYLKCKQLETLSIFYNKIMTVMMLGGFKEYVHAERLKTLEAMSKFESELTRIIEDTCNRSLQFFKKRMRIDRDKGKETSEKKVPLVIGDETGKEMPYTEQATIKTHQLKLRNFVKLVDYLVLTAKINLFKSSALQLERVISETNVIYANRMGKTYGRSCWIRIEIEQHNDQLFFLPPKSAIKDSLEEILFETVMEMCRTHTQYIHLPSFAVYARQRQSERTDEVIELKNVINADQEFNRLISAFRQSINISLENVQQHSLILHDSLELLKRLRKLFAINLQDKDSDFFRAELTAWREDLAKLRAIENEVQIGMYLFDCTNYKKLIEETSTNVTQLLSRRVPELLHERSRNYLKDINRSYKEIEDSPPNLESYFTFLEKVKEVGLESERLQPSINDTIYLLSVADQFGLKPAENIRNQVSEVNGQMIGLRRRLEEIGYSGQAMLEKFKKEIEKLIPTFDDRLKLHEQKLSQLGVYKNTSNVYEKMVEITALSKSLKALNKDRMDLNRYQAALALQETAFDNLDKFTMLFGSVEKMWKARYEWDLLSKNTSRDQIKSLKLTVIRLKIEDTDKVITDCQRELEPNEVISQLKTHVEAFRPLYSVMVNLNDEALLQSHRQEIRQLVVVDTIEAAIKLQQEMLKELFKDMSSDLLTPEFLREIKLHRHSEAIQEITTKAIKEAELSKQLLQLETFWKNNTLQVVLYRDSKDSPILGVNDQLISRIEDNLITTNNILASKYVGFIRGKVELQFKMLHYLHDLLDEWYHHQHTWMYLEPILKSPFAIKNLPKESSTFAQADALWKRLMKQARDNPSVKKYGDEYVSRFTLNQMRNNNASFQVLQKSLQQFLQKKREIFGRFFLLSNLELLQILSNVKQHRDVSRYLPKVFQSVVDVVLDERDSITGLKGADGEVITIKQCLFKGEVEQWFKLVQDMMKSSLRTMVRHEMATYNSQGLERSSWIMSSPPCQVMLAVDGLAWTASTELFLESGQDMDFYDWLEANNQQVEEELTLLKQLVHPHLRVSLTNLIHQNIHQRDILEALLGCESKEDFRWQVRLRFYYQDDTVIARVAGTQSSYGYEYVGLYPSTIGTLETDRYWFNMLNCIGKQKVALLQGQHDSGKTTTFKQLALTLAKNSMVFDCSGSVTPGVLRKLLTGVSYMGSWICFEQVTNLPEAVLSVFAQHLFRIQEALSLSSKDVRIGDKPLLLNSQLGLVMTTRHENFTKFPSNLLSELRPISIWLPDQTKIFETILLIHRVANHKEVTSRIFQFLSRCQDLLMDHPKFGMRDIFSLAHQLAAEASSSRAVDIEQVISKSIKSVIQVRISSKDMPMWRLLISEAFPFHPRLESRESITIHTSIHNKLRDMYLVEISELVDKIQQLRDMASAKSSIIVSGGTLSGKSTVLKVAFEEVVFLSPNCFTNQELLGRFEGGTGNWKDGLLPKFIKQPGKENIVTTLVLDGSIDPGWAEAIAPLLDPSHSTTLASSEKLNFDEKQLRICFECSDLSRASPAVASRCGVIYVPSSTVGYEPIIEAELSDMDDRIRNHIVGLVKSSYKKGIAYIRKNCKEMLPSSAYGLLLSYCKLVRFQLKEEPVASHLQKESWKKLAEKICIFAFTWSLGAVLSPETYGKFDKCLSECFSSEQLKAPMYNYLLSYQKAEGEWVLWSSLSDNYQPQGRKFIPTKEAAIMKHFTFLLTKQLSPFLLMSPPGSGKTISIRQVLADELPSSLPLQLMLPMYSSSKDLQESIEAKLQAQRRSGVVTLLPPPGQRLICVVDDINIAYSQANSSIELLRSLFTTSVLWDRKVWTSKNIIDYQIIYTLSSGRSLTLPERFLRHFNMVYVPQCEQASLHLILNTFTKTLQAVNSAVETFLDSRYLASATIQLFAHIRNLVSCSPQNPQVMFNQHHMLELFSNIERAFNPNKDLTVNHVNTLIKLWIHQARQIVNNRLNSKHSQQLLEEELQKLVIVVLKYNEDPTQLFSENIVFSPLNINHYYSHVPNPPELIAEIAKIDPSVHLSRKFAEHLHSAVRAFSQPRGNYIVQADNGQGRSTIVHLAAKLLGYNVERVLPNTKLLPVLKRLCEEKKPIVFLLSNPHPRVIQQLLMLPRLTKEDQEQIGKTTNIKSFGQIITKYLHIGIIFSTGSEGLRRAIRTLPCLTNLFSIDCWAQHTESSLTETAEKMLVSKSQQTSLQAVGMMLYRLSNLTSIGQYMDLFPTYEQHYQKTLWLTERKHNALSKAINKYEQTKVKLQSIRLKMEEDIPKKDKSIAVGEQCFEKLQGAQQNAIRYKATLDVEEKELEDETQKVADEKRDLDRIIAEMAAPVEGSAQSLANLTRNQLSEMKQLYLSPNTPADLKFALECIAIVLQESIDADGMKKMVNDPGFSQRAKQLDYYNIPKKVQQALRAKLASNPAFKSSQMKSVNTVGKCICEWVWAINNFPQAYRTLDQRRAALQKLTDSINSVLKVVTEKRQHMEGLNMEIRQLENEYHKCVEEKELFEKDIQNAVGQLERGQQLIEATNVCYERWKTQLEKTRWQMDNLKCDVFYACCEMVLLAGLPSEKRDDTIYTWRSALAEVPGFKLRDDFSTQVVLAGLPKYRRIMLNFGWCIDQAMLANLLYSQKSAYPLVMVDPYGWARQVFALDPDPVVLLEFDAATFQDKFCELANLQKTTCIVCLHSAEQLNEVRGLLNWNMFQAARPQHIGKRKLVASPSFRWHFLVKEGLQHSSYRIVSFQPSKMSILHRINLVTNRSEYVRLSLEKAQLAGLQILQNEGILNENEWFVTDAYESVASELFEEPDLIANIQKSSKSVVAALAKLGELEFKEVPVQAGLVDRLYQIYSNLERIKPSRALYSNMAIGQFLRICQALKIQSFDPEGMLLEATQSIHEQLRNHVVTRKHLLTLFFELSMQVAASSNTITPEHIALLEKAMSVRSNRQLFYELAQLAKWPNYRLKDWELDLFWENPLGQCKKRQWHLSPFEKILCFVRTASRDLIPSIEQFIKSCLKIDVAHPTESFSIRQLYMQQPVEPVYVLDMVDDTTQINIVKEVQKLAREAGLPRFKVYSLGDRDMHSRIETSIKKSLNDGGWTVMSNCHLEHEFTRQKIQEIRAAEKCHERFRLTVVQNSYAHLQDRYYIKSSFDLEEQMHAVLREVPEALVKLHHLLNEHFKDRFHNEDLLQVLKLLEPILRKKKLEEAWASIRLILVDYVYFSRINSKSEYEELCWLFDQHHEGANETSTQSDNQLIKAGELIKQLGWLHVHNAPAEKYSAVLKTCESFINRLPITIKKKAVIGQKPLIGSTVTDYLEPYITDEAQLNNSYIKELEAHLKNLKMAIKGEIPLDNATEQIITTIANEDVPEYWRKYLPHAQSLGEAFNHLIYRCEQLRIYLNEKTKIYELPVFTHPRMFIQTVLFGESRRRRISTFALTFDHVFKLPPAEKQLAESDGIFLKGVLCRGFAPDIKTQLIRESHSQSDVTPCPLIHLRPVENHPLAEGVVEIPLILTTASGELQQIPIRCKTTEPREFWRMRKSCFMVSLRS